MRVLLDTNVLISAILFGGVPNDCLRRALAGEFELVTSTELLDELERILRERFDVPAEAVAFARGDLELAAVVVAPTRVEAVSRDPTDDRVLAAAKEGRADHIVTGDQDLLALGRYGGISIVTPRGFVRLLLEREAP
ncbi:MAG: putative toxin-antitoxin system toxin component, PIN family [Chloroflexi bacterium]|nr:putative toxin-antitoxin system toxin component, PIN family [Chloroflexota bacterium]